MSVALKRSEANRGVIPPECPYGCCTSVYGRNVKRVRREVKRKDNEQFRRDVSRGDF